MRKFLMLLMMLGLICLNAAALAGTPAAENNAANAVQRPFSERLNKAAAEENSAKAAVLYVNNANTTYDAI